TGTGKTHIAIADAKRLGFRTLYLAHRTDLIKQTQHRFLELWPEVTSQVFRKKSGKPDAHVVLSTIQAMSDSLELFDPKEFGYIVFDEAHHVAAPIYRKVLAYFRARFILGLTATPERHDGQSLLDLFQTTAHRLELEEAISRGLLVPIRCVRVRTNVDLTHIRFNGVDYRASDLEIHLFIPDRDRLIVDTYTAHVAGKRAVCFCVNVAHAENLALEFQRQGIAAAHVSGRMDAEQRQATLEKYQHGEIQVLCACDILTEGWDSPETEALFMARPTLSKVVYIQQLGRGTRKAPGKNCLYVFDFIDNTTRYTQAMSAHRLLRKEKYFPGALIAAPVELLQIEDQQIAGGEKTIAHLGLHLWAERYEPIDIFRWQDEVKDMLQAHELERELGVGQRTVRNWIGANRLQPDHTIEMGNRVYHYFKKERVAQIRTDFGLVEVTSENIKQQFFEFVTEMDMSSSYKPVLLLGLLELADDRGRVNVPALVQFFRTFYLNRQAYGQKVEADGKRMNKVATLTDTEIASVMLEMPFEKFERRKYLRYLKEVTVIKFQDALWKILTVEDRRQLKEIAQTAINSYYARI
ncbi:MAG TPA: DEAD/DEAH box helicase family protein, partial [Acidobacteriota bacterium]|nr:DEAD/DEAH box helicase family protein [Acidobacteriota bacterium]